MFASPFLLIAGVGAHARLFVDPFEPTGYSHQGQQRIFAYKDVVEHTRGAANLKLSPTDRLAIADSWIAGYKEGKLQPIFPATDDDSTQEGIRGEIFQAVSQLNESLYRQAKRAASQGDLKLAKDTLLKSLQVSEIIKYSDFTILNALRLQQTHALKKLNSLEIKSPSERKEIASSLQALLAEQRPLDNLAVLERRQYSESHIRAGLESVSIEDPLANASGRELRPNEQVFLASQTDAMPAVHSAIRFGFQNEEQFKAILEKSILKWSEPESTTTASTLQ